jgi:hypothetical protein
MMGRPMCVLLSELPTRVPFSRSANSCGPPFGLTTIRNAYQIAHPSSPPFASDGPGAGIVAYPVCASAPAQNGFMRAGWIAASYTRRKSLERRRGEVGLGSQWGKSPASCGLSGCTASS